MIVSAKDWRRPEFKESQELAASVDAEDASTVTVTAEQMAASYAALIRDTVTSYWSRPPSARNGMQAVLELQLIPTGEIVSAEDLGGADVHCRTSGVTDHYANNDHHALQLMRRSVARLNRVKPVSMDLREPIEPAYPVEDIYGVIPADSGLLRRNHEIIRVVIALT